jgi:hypothetical protein
MTRIAEPLLRVDDKSFSIKFRFREIETGFEHFMCKPGSEGWKPFSSVKKITWLTRIKDLKLLSG